MRKRGGYIILIFLFLSGVGFSMVSEGRLSEQSPLASIEEGDSLKSRYPLKKQVMTHYEELARIPSTGLKGPGNIRTTIEYDIRTGQYLVCTRIGDKLIGTPLRLTPEEYQQYSLLQAQRSFFYQKNKEHRLFAEGDKKKTSGIHFELPMVDRIFGPGGVRVKTQGSAEISLGFKNSKTQNPSLPERSRNRTFFHFDENVQLNLQATVGTKVNFDMNYNTESMFDFDQKQLNLSYTGDEDEIIKSIQAGNVSMTTGNSLIRGGAALFGLKSELQFGKLRIHTLFAQQNSESRTVSSKGGAQTRSFEIPIDEYDENRHFFLSYYFRDQYDEAMSRLPYIKSPVSITRLEVWVTNRRGDYSQSRNIVAFSDLGEGCSGTVS